jgi:hypothetical protein
LFNCRSVVELLKSAEFLHVKFWRKIYPRDYPEIFLTLQK